MVETRQSTEAEPGPHHAEEVRVKACDSLSAAIGTDHRLRARLEAGQHVCFRVGSSGDGPVARAFDIFKQRTFVSDGAENEAAAMTKHGFYRLLQTWAPRYFDGTNRQCVTRRRRRAGLTAAQKHELCHLLGSARQDENGTYFWRDLEDAMAQHPERERIAELVTASGTTHAALQDELVAFSPRLSFGIVDRCDKLVPGTLAKRQAAAKVWRQEVPFLEVLDGQLAQPWSGKYAVGEVGAKFWVPPWDIFRYFTFMLDAASITDEQGPAHTRVKGFYDPTRVYLPEEVRPSRSSTSARKLFFYAITCMQLGLVAGPHYMYHEASSTRCPRELRAARLKKEPFIERHDPEYPSWCARPRLPCLSFKRNHACTLLQESTTLTAICNLQVQAVDRRAATTV